jgi:P27 family predicted phage terminase small subunit
MGRKPIPTARKIASGAAAKDPKRINRREPKPLEGAPKRPTHFDRVASAMWRRLVSLFDEMGMLNQADGDMMAAYCDNESAYRQALLAVRKTGQVLGSGTKLTRNPHSVELHKYADRKLKMLAEMGLTPSSRTKVMANPKAEDDPFAEWLKANREMLN